MKRRTTEKDLAELESKKPPCDLMGDFFDCSMLETFSGEKVCIRSRTLPYNSDESVYRGETETNKDVVWTSTGFCLEKPALSLCIIDDDKLPDPPESIAPETPAHYAGSVTPWDLERCMVSSGDAFVDARRTDAIEYAFRIKEDLAADLRKAIHCLQAAVEKFEQNKQNK